ncbi:MAG: hypothetical protein FJY74_07905 [Candidatus Eisenbacteria bacterium]|nr:hypothetical protein [Candidatus Eisenbacteria bacterium]
MRVRFPHWTVLATVLLTAVAAVAPAQEENGDGEPEGAPADTTAVGQEEAPDHTVPFRIQVATPLRPTYKLTYGRDQDASSWEHSFGFRQRVSERISFQASSLISVRSTEVLSRENRQERWSAGLDASITSAVGMAVRLNRTTQSDVRNQGSSSEVRSFREKETADVSTSYSKTLLSGIATTLNMTAGLEKNRYADVQSRGAAQSIAASVGYNPTPGVKGSVTYSGRHSLLDSEQGALSSTDESESHSLGANVDYTWKTSTLNVNLARSRSANEYPKEQQKERREQENDSASVKGTFKPLPGLDLTLGYDYSRSGMSYALEPSRRSVLSSRAVNAGVTYTFAGVRLSSQLASDVKRNEYTNEQTGNSYGQSLVFNANRDFGTRVKVGFTGRMTLYSHHFDDTVRNDQDRDLYDREATLQIDYNPRNDLLTSLALRVREDQLIYIRTSRTGDNRRAQTFSLRPSVTKVFSKTFSASQRYELTADYTLYTFNDAKNFLVRNLGVTTEARWSGARKLDLTVSHRYVAQDEGSYVTGSDGIARYGKNSERDDHTMKATLRYRLFDAIGIEASQSYSVSQRWTIVDGGRRLSWERHDTSLTGKASVDYKLEDGTTLKASVARTDRDATSLVERLRRVWDVSLSIDKAF